MDCPKTEGLLPALDRCGTFSRAILRHASAVLVLLVVSTLSGDRSVKAQEAFISREQEIEAAYLYNFGKYVTWPEGQSAKPFVIGFIGESPIQEPLVRLARSKTLNERTIVIKQFQAAGDYVPCDILFVPDGQNPALVDGLLKRAQIEATLIVGHSRKSVVGGAMISFYPEGNTLKFEIDLKAAKRARLKISSKLLALGKIVAP